MRLRTGDMQVVFRSSSALFKVPLYQKVMSRRVKSSTQTPLTTSRPVSVLSDTRLTPHPHRTKHPPFRSSVINTRHSIVSSLRSLQDPALSRSQKTMLTLQILRSLSEEEGFYQTTMTAIVTQLEEDLICNLHSLPEEVLREFQKYDEDLERKSDKVPFYAIVDALRSALQLQMDILERTSEQFHREISNLQENLHQKDEEIRILHEKIAEYTNRPKSYEGLYRDLLTEHTKTVHELRELREHTFTRKDKFKAMKCELENMKEVLREQQIQLTCLQRDLGHLRTVKERKEAKLATTRDILQRREAVFKETIQVNEDLKSELVAIKQHCEDLENALEEAKNTTIDPSLTPRPEWSLCPWRSEESERQGKSSRELLEELVKMVEIGRMKLARKKSMREKT